MGKKKNSFKFDLDFWKQPDRPEAVRIGPFVYTVSFDRQDLLAACVENQHNLDGRTHNGRQEIVIDHTNAPSYQGETLVHEVLHAIFHANGIGWDMEDGKEESLIRKLSPALYAFVRDNPDVISWLQS